MSIPEDFGKIGGTEISNKNSILDEIDNAIGCKSKIEYILVRPTSVIRLPFGYGLAFNGYGHAALRYRLPNGKDIVMNIEGKKDGRNMVKFYSPEEYFFGLHQDNKAEQLGIYNRDMITIRVHNVPDEKIVAMHEFFMDLHNRHSLGEAKFNIILGPLYNSIRKVFPNMAQIGNCARWTSEGLLKAGVTTNLSIWPKSIWINMFENYKDTEIKEKDNMDVVYYERIPHAYHEYGLPGDNKCIDMVSPLQSLRSISYINMYPFSRVRVNVPKSTTIARININKNPAQPSQFRNIVNSKYAIGSSTIGSLYLIGKYARKIKFFI